MHCKVFQNALLDLFQTVVVTRQHLARAVERIIILRISTPREIGNRLQIGVQHVNIGRAGRHVFQTLQILIDLFAHGGLEVDLVQLLAQFGHIRQICAAQFLANHLHLFAQEVFTLILFHQLANFGFQLHLQPGLLGFLCQQHAKALNARRDADDVEHFELLRHGFQNVRCNQVAELIAVVYLFQIIRSVLGNLGRNLRILVEKVHQHAAGSGEQQLCAVFLGEILNLCHRRALYHLNGEKTRAAHAFHRHTDRAARRAQNALNARNHADFVERLIIGHSHGVHLMGRQKDLASFIQRALKRGNAFITAEFEIGVHVGENDELVQRYKGKKLHKAVGDIVFVFHKTLILFVLLRNCCNYSP